jgi:hypothetical protein
MPVKYRHPLSHADLYDKVQRQFFSQAVSSTSAHFKFLLALDEAQVLGRLGNSAYLDSDHRTAPPVLAPILHAFRSVSSDEDRTCVMPCATDLSHYELVRSEGASSDAKLSKDQFEAAKEVTIFFIVDIPHLTDKTSASSYIDWLGRALGGEEKAWLANLFPKDMIKRLFWDFRGRFRHYWGYLRDKWSLLTVKKNRDRLFFFT